MLPIEIAPLAESHFAGLYRAFDSISREGRFFVFLQATPEADSFAYYRSALKDGWPYRVALRQGEVLGWCDIAPLRGGACAHAGVLGIGLLPHARGQGLGARLMHATLEAAWARGLSRVELGVRADNLNAIALYQRLGFKVEGTHAKSFCVNGVYADSYTMALVR
jgi:RimJ/RimL family protein N-acetyltransferase